MLNLRSVYENNEVFAFSSQAQPMTGIKMTVISQMTHREQKSFPTTYKEKMLLSLPLYSEHGYPWYHAVPQPYINICISFYDFTVNKNIPMF